MKIKLFTLLLCFSVQLNAQDFTQSPFQNISMSSPVVADFDGDDFEDVVGQSSDNVVLVINDGTSPISFTQKNVNLQFAAKGIPAVGDVDDDDDIDIIFAEGANLDLSILENDGDANFTVVALNVGGTDMLQLKDLEGDDDLDIIGINTETNVLDIYVNDGSQNFSEINLLFSAQNLESFDAADMDDDGDIDIVLGFDDDFAGQQISLMENNGSNSFFTIIIASNEFSSLKKLIVEDIDGDEKLDIVAMKNFSCAAWINQGGLAFELKDLSLDADGGIFRTITAGDYNGDNKMDIVTGPNSGNIAWHKNTSFDPYTYERRIVGGVAPCFTAANGDFDNDGDVDLVVSNGEFWWYENEIVQEPPVSTINFSETQIEVFPNPFQDFIQIKNITPSNYRMELSTGLGKIVFSEVITSEKVDLPQLESGIYFLSLINLTTLETRSTQLIKM